MVGLLAIEILLSIAAIYVAIVELPVDPINLSIYMDEIARINLPI
jgi:hypothetical protein